MPGKGYVCKAGTVRRSLAILVLFGISAVGLVPEGGWAAGLGKPPAPGAFLGLQNVEFVLSNGENEKLFRFVN